MSLNIDFTPAEEARLFAASRQSGLAPAELIKRITLDHLPMFALTAENELDIKLRQWQEHDDILYMPDISAQILFAQWAEEDAGMTPEEIVAEDKLWESVEKSLVDNRRLQLRRDNL